MGQSTPQPNDVGRNNPVALGIMCLVVIEAPLKLSALGWPLTRGFVLLWGNPNAVFRAFVEKLITHYIEVFFMLWFLMQ